MRDENGIMDIFVDKLRDLLFQVERGFPGVRIIAVDSIEDEILFGESYIDDQDAIVEASIKSGEMIIGKDGTASFPTLRT